MIHAVAIILAVYFALEPLFYRARPSAPRRQEARAPAMSRAIAYVLCVGMVVLGTIGWSCIVVWVWRL
jgi:hypothetical protein